MRKNKRLADGAACTFCGSIAATVEHSPPKVLFLNSDCPKGWEFPACDKCNEGTRQSDQIFAFFVFSSILDPSPPEWAHLRKLIRGIWNNQPQVIDEVVNNTAQIRFGSVLTPTSEGPALVTMGDALQSHIDRVADKLALAALKKLKGTGVSKRGLVWHDWRTNYDFSMSNVPKVPVSFGPLSFIEQGSKTSKGQFAFRASDATGENAVFRFALQKRVLLTSIVFKPASDEEALNARGNGFRSPMTIEPKRPISLSLAPQCQIIRPPASNRNDRLV